MYEFVTNLLMLNGKKSFTNSGYIARLNCIAVFLLFWVWGIALLKGGLLSSSWLIELTGAGILFVELVSVAKYLAQQSAWALLPGC